MIRILVFLCLLISGAAQAQEQKDVPKKKPDLAAQAIEKVKANPYKNFISVAIENDSIGGGTDSNYSSGIRASYFNVNANIPEFIHEIAEHIPTFDINETTSLTYSIGQNLYTPQAIKSPLQDPNDRPWAAWLYTSMGLATLTSGHIDELELTLGIVGPAALGERSQETIHSLIGSPDPKGWDNQLKNEPGLVVSWLRRWPERQTFNAVGLTGTIEPNINVSLGNIYTYGGAGVSFKIGPTTERWQDTPPRVRPAIPGSGYFEIPRNDWSWYLFAGADGRAVARNIFLDGNTLRDSHDVNKKPFVVDLSAGLALTYKQARISYSLNYRSDEFKGQKEDSVFGAVSLSYAF